MIAALDGTPLTLSSGGLRRYTEELLRALQAEFPLDSIQAVSDQLTPASNPLDRRWWSIGLPRHLLRNRVEVFHGTNFAVPWLPVCASVMMIHDLSPWMNPAWHTNAGHVRRRTPLILRLGLATLIGTGTEAVRKQILAHFQLDPARVVVIPDAPAPHLRADEVSPPARPYFLFLGTVEPRKNVPALIEAWHQVRRTHDVDLVIAGRHREDASPITAAPGLKLLGEIPDADLPALLARATALVYPSLYEGFGLPVVEAMQCGVPVITSNDPALREVASGAALHCEAADLAHTMRTLLDTPGLAHQLRAAGLRRAADFSWRHTARLTREAWLEAMARRRGTARRT
jgi:glycosyltransferase involved in cell wall biosynthesis